MGSLRNQEKQRRTSVPIQIGIQRRLCDASSRQADGMSFVHGYTALTKNNQEFEECQLYRQDNWQPCLLHVSSVNFPA